MPDITKCQLHIPHKGWSGNPLEEQNYLEIERWSIRLADCGSCTCYMAQYQNAFTVHTSATLHQDRSTFTALTSPCGTIDTSAITQVTVDIQWQAATTDVLGNLCDSWLISPGLGEGGALEQYGSTVPAFHGKNPKVSFARILPGRPAMWAGVPWSIYFFQNTGADLIATVNVFEYQPCCHCNWTFPY